MKKLVFSRDDGSVKAVVSLTRNNLSAARKKSPRLFSNARVLLGDQEAPKPTIRRIRPVLKKDSSSDLTSLLLQDKKTRSFLRSRTVIDRIVWSHHDFNYGSSLPHVSRETCLSLKRAGIDTKILLWPEWSDKNSAPADFGVPQVSDAEIQSSAVIIMARALPPLQLFNQLRACKAPFVAAYYMLEGTLAKTSEVRRLEAYDAVFVPSSFCAKALVDSGLKTPVFVWGHGFDPKIFPYVEPSPNRLFTYLYFGSENRRKGNSEFLEAFSRLNLPDCRAIYHVNRLRDTYRTLEKYGADPRIKIEVATTPPDQLIGLAKETDVIVCPYRAEGFDLPMLEFMGSGRAAIATRHSGPLDFGGGEDLTYWVDPAGWEKSQGDLRGCFDAGVEAVPDVLALSNKMEWCYHNPEDVRSRGRRASLIAHEGWTWDKKALEIIPALKAIIPKTNFLDIASQAGVISKCLPGTDLYLEKLEALDRQRRSIRRSSSQVDRIVWSFDDFRWGNSLAHVGRETVNLLRSFGVPAFIAPWSPESRVPADMESLKAFNSDILTAAVIVMARDPGRHRQRRNVCLQRMREAGAPFVAAYYMTEGTLAKESEVCILEAYDAVFTPTSFCRDALVNAGLTVPVFVWGHGFDPKLFPYTPSRKERPFTYLWFGDTDYAAIRKGYDLFLEAFSRVKRPDVRAWVHGRRASSQKSIWPRYRADRRIVWDESLIPPEKLKDMMSEADVIVCPFRGEGFAMCALEAMASGRALISTRFSGPLDFGGGDDLTFWVDIGGKEPAINDAGYQVIPDMNELVEKMGYCADHPEEVRVRGERASKIMHESWTWKKKVMDILPVLDTLIPGNKIPRP